MKYADFRARTAFSKVELLGCAWGTLVRDPPAGGLATLPAPPMLMLDRVVEIVHDGQHGRIVAEQDIELDAWFFQCHFRTDPVQPGCLGIEAIWQLLGFYASVRGGRGCGRALGAKEIDFFGQIRPHNRLVRYEIAVRRYIELTESGGAIAIGTGQISVDGDVIYTVKDAKVGVFPDIGYADYPELSPNTVGQVLMR